MRIEMVAGAAKVIRFPVELRQRPSMKLLRRLRPDTRVLFMQAEGMGFELPPHGLRDQTDAATAEHIATHLAPNQRASDGFLENLLQPLLDRAVEAARKADDAAAAAWAAQQALGAAPSDSYRANRLREWVLEAAERAVRLGLEAYLLTEETEGVARAVRYARRGENWVSRDGEAEMDILITAEEARRGRG